MSWSRKGLSGGQGVSCWTVRGWFWCSWMVLGMMTNISSDFKTSVFEALLFLLFNGNRHHKYHFCSSNCAIQCILWVSIFYPCNRPVRQFSSIQEHQSLVRWDKLFKVTQLRWDSNTRGHATHCQTILPYCEALPPAKEDNEPSLNSSFPLSLLSGGHSQISGSILPSVSEFLSSSLLGYMLMMLC